jgi:hypothetical protein
MRAMDAGCGGEKVARIFMIQHVVVQERQSMLALLANFCVATIVSQPSGVASVGVASRALDKTGTLHTMRPIVMKMFASTARCWFTFDEGRAGFAAMWHT